MKWLINFFTSSIGQKLVMSLTGLFLISFLPIHLLGNFQLIYDDSGQDFNEYAHFMTGNPVIKSISYGLYFFIVLHAIQGILIWFRNRKAKGPNYKVKTNQNSSFASRNMALLGTLILAFLFIHMGDFWWKMKMGETNMVLYEGMDHQVQDLYEKVAISFSNPMIVITYILGLIALAFHLLHGFQSAFQTLGINHKKYTPFIQFLGKAYSIVIPLLYAVLPLYFYFYK